MTFSFFNIKANLFSFSAFILVFYGLTIIVICDARKQRAKILLFFDIYKFLSIYLLNRGDFYGMLQVFFLKRD